MKLKCHECGYIETEDVDIKYLIDENTSITCPNCSSGEMIVIDILK
jgi:Zn finger protein HypA/HybF involved in hydrogenase expression